MAAASVAGCEIARSDPHGRWAWSDSLGVGAAFAVGALVAGRVFGTEAIDDVASAVVTVVSAVLAIAGAVLAAALSAAFGQVRMLWLAGALGAYGLVLLVSAAVDADPSPFREFAATVNIAGVLIGLGSLVVYVTTYRHQALGSLARRWWAIFGGTVGVVILAASVAARWSHGVGVVSATVPPTVAALAGGCVGVVLLVAARHSRSRGLWRVGLGLAAVAAAYLVHHVPPWDGAVGRAGFEVGRLVGLAAVLTGLVDLFREDHRRRRDRERELLAELARARRSRRTQAERDHELRNSITGLSHLVPLLGGGPEAPPDDIGTLSSAAESELSRMEQLLDRGLGSSCVGVLDLAAVVRRAVLTHAAQADVMLDVPRGLVARGSESTLSLVMVNVLTNCARHAPGSAIRISARRRDDRVVLEVADGGKRESARLPTVPPAHGQGIGLGVSRRLLEQEGARLEIVRGDTRSGHTVLVDLPAVV